jgi:hypothetical protein
MQQLAQIELPTMLLEVLWDRTTKTIAYSHQGVDTVLPDEPIGVTLARHLNRPTDELSVSNLRYFEHPHESAVATEDMIRQFLTCNWSDYANDNMLFQCTIR